MQRKGIRFGETDGYVEGKVGGGREKVSGKWVGMG